MANKDAKSEDAEDTAPLIEKDPVLAEINKRILDAFDIFDHEGSKSVDVREVGTIIRSLDCYPSESELRDMIQEVEEEEATGYIQLERFQPMMSRVLLEKRYQPSSEESLVKAFEVLDQDHKSHLTCDELKKVMTEDGEPFTTEEIEEMLAAAIDPDKGVVLYRDFVTMMVPESNQT